MASLIGFGFALFGFVLLAYRPDPLVATGQHSARLCISRLHHRHLLRCAVVALGIIGEYLARMHFRTMDRPPYAVATGLMRQAPMNQSADDFNLSSTSLRLRANLVPWDRGMLFGFPVVQIQILEVIDSHGAMSDYADFRAWLDSGQVRVVSSRLPHHRLRESCFWRPANGFRFVETVLHPALEKPPA